MKLPALSTRFRIVIGLASLMVSVLLGAMALNIVPDRREAIMQGRSQLCEAIAVNSSVLVNRGDIQRLQAILTVLVSRHTEIQSAGIRQVDGELVVDIASHDEEWQENVTDHSTDSQVYVPLQNTDGKWGTLEIRFTPLHGDLWFEIAHNPWVRLIGFVTSLCLLSWYLYLGKILEQLNPSKSVPGRVRETLDTLAEGLLAIDRKGRIALCNRAFAITLGEEPEKLVGRKVLELPWQREATLSQEPETFPWDRVLSGEQTLAQATLQLLASDGTLRIYQVNCASVGGSEDQVRGVFCCFEDVTMLEAQKVELARSRASADAANQAKSTFLANMSHEIRTPMNAILGFTEVLRRGMYDDPTQQAEYLETIHSSGQHLLRLINDILDLSKVEAGRLEVERMPCCPHQLLLEVVTVLKGKADEKQLRLDCQTPEGLPEVIETDPGRVRQILTNVIGNALKFTEHGGVSVVARMLCGTKTRLQIDVIDTGVGMSAEAMLKIFDPFSQADNSITRRFGGTGLGLTISKSFAESLGGDLTVTSVAGEGSTFTMVVDAGSIDQTARVLDISEFAANARHERKPAKGKRFQFNESRILLVDDGDANRKLIQLLLQRNGLLVETAVNGQIAVDKATTSKYDVILMDMQMPVMDGYTATRKLREHGLEIPIVALTANAMRGDEVECREAGCTGFLTKPVDLDGLINYLAELLNAEECVNEMNGDLPTLQPLAPAVAFTPANANSSIRATGIPAIATRDKNDVAVAKTMPDVAVSLDEIISKVQPTPDFDPYDTANVFPAELMTRTAVPGTPRKRITSELPFDDPEFQEIIVGFVEKLRSEVDELQKVWQRRDLEAVARIAHWLKGAAGTMGFRDFTEPGLHLMNLARDERADEISPVIRELVAMVAAIELPEPA